MAVNFPSSPTNGQIYIDTVSGNIYIYDSTSNKWSSDVAALNAGISTQIDYGLITSGSTGTIDYGSLT